MKLSPETCFNWPDCCCSGECADDKRRWRGGALLVVIASLTVWAIVFAALWLVLTIDRAEAHQAPSGWDYPPSCCFGTASGGDCQAISSKTVTPISGGYRITLSPGDHNQVTKPHVFDVPASMTRISEDTSYHICLWPTEDKVQCFFAPPMSY